MPKKFHKKIFFIISIGITLIGLGFLLYYLSTPVDYVNTLHMTCIDIKKESVAQTTADDYISFRDTETFI